MSLFWDFVDCCDQARSVRAVRDLFSDAIRSLGLDGFAILTHAPTYDLRSLGVMAHNWSDAAISHFQAGQRDGRGAPLFEAVECTLQPVEWFSGDWRKGLKRDQLLWLDRLGAMTGASGATWAIKTALVNASCSVTSHDPISPDRLRVCTKMATSAFHQILFLQKPRLSETDRLTAREHECLYRAVVLGERPSQVARRLGIKVSTVRTLRQKANGRLDADNSEQAVWRMLETGQLFSRGRMSKPRRW